MIGGRPSRKEWLRVLSRADARLLLSTRQVYQGVRAGVRAITYQHRNWEQSARVEILCTELAKVAEWYVGYPQRQTRSRADSDCQPRSGRSLSVIPLGSYNRWGAARSSRLAGKTEKLCYADY